MTRNTEDTTWAWLRYWCWYLAHHDQADALAEVTRLFDLSMASWRWQYSHR